MAKPLFRKIDAYLLPVPDLRKAVEFYEGKLGHRVIWKMKGMVGLRMPETDAELVLATKFKDAEVDLLVDSAEAAAKRFVEAGGKLVAGPIDIPVGKVVVLEDPWGNVLTALDMSKGPIAGLGGELDSAIVRKCLTPGGQFDFETTPSAIRHGVRLPKELFHDKGLFFDVSAEEAKRIEDLLHDAMECIMSPHWPGGISPKIAFTIGAREFYDPFVDQSIPISKVAGGSVWKT